MRTVPVAVLREALLRDWRWTPAQVNDLVRRIQYLAKQEDA